MSILITDKAFEFVLKLGCKILIRRNGFDEPYIEIQDGFRAWYRNNPTPQELENELKDQRVLYLEAKITAGTAKRDELREYLELTPEQDAKQEFTRGAYSAALQSTNADWDYADGVPNM